MFRLYGGFASLINFYMVLNIFLLLVLFFIYFYYTFLYYIYIAYSDVFPYLFASK